MAYRCPGRRPTGLEAGAWLLAACGGLVVGVGLFFVVLRPPLLPEDLKYLATTQASLDAALPRLGVWLQKVFWVMGGYTGATGLLTVHLALTGVRESSTSALVVAGAAGAASVGVMAATNLMLRSDFRWPLLALAVAWATAVLLAALGS